MLVAGALAAEVKVSEAAHGLAIHGLFLNKCVAHGWKNVDRRTGFGRAPFMDRPSTRESTLVLRRGGPVEKPTVKRSKEVVQVQKSDLAVYSASENTLEHRHSFKQFLQWI